MATGTGQTVGHNEIEVVSRGCVLIEHWENAGGRGGKSISFYDAGRGTWRQTFVFDSGAVVEYTEGGLVDGSMVMDGTFLASSGPESLRRMTLTPNPDGTVRQLIEASTDQGATWTVAFDANYVREDPGLP